MLHLFGRLGWVARTGVGFEATSRSCGGPAVSLGGAGAGAGAGAGFDGAAFCVVEPPGMVAA